MKTKTCVVRLGLARTIFIVEGQGNEDTITRDHAARRAGAEAESGIVKEVSQCWHRPSAADGGATVQCTYQYYYFKTVHVPAPLAVPARGSEHCGIQSPRYSEGHAAIMLSHARATVPAAASSHS